jgi:DNA polymerase delta subunit 1
MQEGYVIPTLDRQLDDTGYEGAIVLEPETRMYMDDVVAVMDYNSLYPSSIIAENLSHDTIVLDPKYRDLPGVRYNEVEYDIYAGKGEEGMKVAVRKCTYVHSSSKQGVIPRILKDLLSARKNTRKCMLHKLVRVPETGEEFRCSAVAGQPDGSLALTVLPDGHAHVLPPMLAATASVGELYDHFQKAVLDGLQLAYKVTANSLYGQMGASTSPVFLKDIAACTTAVGRGIIVKAKFFMERNYGARVVYGDTDSIFCVFDLRGEAGDKLQGDAAIMAAMDVSDRATAEFNKTLTAPQNLEAEKCFYPFCLLSKKRYIGIKYPQVDPSQPLVGKRSEMGIALKRRDNAPIVKHVYGGIVDIILKERDVDKSVAFLRENLQKLVDGEASLDSLIVTKSLRATYPERIAHKVLAERIGARDPGSKP